tara:strand:- start:297 stop:713 length:417 start_codon:yes stop_codon:yes gene_type:complete
MFKKLINFFSLKNNKKLKPRLPQKEELEKKWVEYIIETGRRYEITYPNEELMFEKTSIIISEDVFKLLVAGESCSPDGDHWYNLFLFNNWLYFERAGHFYGKAEVTKFKDGYKLSKCFFRWCDVSLLKDLLKEMMTYV